MKNKYIFMYRKFVNDLKKPKVSYKLCEELHSEKLGEYYFLFDEGRVATGKDQKLISKFDKNGIPVNRTYIDVTDKDYVYFPISIGQMGLAVFHSYLKTGSDEDKRRFLKFAEWFYKNAEVSEKLGARWMTDVALPAYQNPGPWASAFSQSRGISILLRAYQLNGCQDYADMARDALKPFTIAVADGGVSVHTKWGTFYEEYTSSEPTLVLNGMIFALCGVYDFVRVFSQAEDAKNIFDNGMQTLENILPEFDLGFWSRYNLCAADWYPKIDPATIGYQRLHITQLQFLFKLSGKPIFREYADKFSKQDNFSNAVRMYMIKYKSLKKIGRL